MLLNATRFLQLMIGALVVGTMFAVWAGYDPRGFSYTTYVEQHHNAVRGLNVLIPALAMLTTVLTLFAAWLQRAWRSQVMILLAAVVLMLCAGLVTRFGDQPINAIVDTWPMDSPPADWEVLRADWWTYHLIRMGFGTIGYALIVWSVVRPQRTTV
ncbi:MAG: DUF1772 domain-containing protein [Flavobacteriales bacterium]|nr:DUF1772 domain-containing protein [Flavobacteriales bacterium]MCC6939402.1 DUF1772 domain-containing protein [Flavobacteriales bacterium]